MPVRVVQWTTGNVGKQSVQAIVCRPDLELVGCFAWSPDKVGRDVGELCGIDPIGVTASNDIDALLALEPDCVVYNPMWRDVDEMVRILESGVDVVSTAAFVTGHALGADRDRIAAACRCGGSTMFGTGISPGFVELVAIVAAGVCDRVDKVTIAAGCVAGLAASWQGRVGDRTVVELTVRWKKGQTLDPDWPIGMGHTITIDGRPTIQTSVSFLPPPDFQATTMEEFMVLGHIMTAVPAINAIPGVVAAPPGIVTYNDLALPLPKGYVS